MSGLRTIYNGPVYTPVGDRLADELELGDFVFARVLGFAAYGLVARLTPGSTLGRRTVRVRLVDEIDGTFRGEHSYDAHQSFAVRRLSTTGRTS